MRLFVFLLCAPVFGASLAVTPAVVPYNASGINLVLTGSSTSWSGGTTFTVTGVTNATKTSQAVASTTAATMVISTGNFTGTVTVSDGTSTTTIRVAHPGFNATWGAAVLGTGAVNSGDTWLLMDTVNGVRSLVNDTVLVGTPCGSPPCGRATALFSLPPDISSVTLINGVSGFGTENERGLGYCTGGADGALHSGAPFTYNGKYVFPVRCTAEDNVSLAFSTSHDDWAHLFRSQDWTAVSAGSCSAGAATLTTSGSTSSSGDLVMISHVGVVADREYTLTSGSNSTTLNFAATCTGSFTAGSAIGPGSANGVPPTTPMWTVAASLNMGHPNFVNYCVDNVACSPVVDSNDTYLNGISIKFNTYDNPIAFRLLKTDMDQFPGDATKYTYLQSNGTYGALATAVPLQCTIQGTTSACPSNWITFFFNVSYFADPALPDGGQYLAVSSSGQMGLLTASHIAGPWTFVPAYPVSGAFSPPVPEVSAATAPSLYTAVSSVPYIGNLRVQFSGFFTSAHYQQVYKDLTLTILSPNASPIFNAAPTPGIAGRGGQFHHAESGLIAYWDMQSPDLVNLVDKSTNGLTIPITNSPTPNTGLLNNIYITTSQGIENANSALNASWGSIGGAWKIPTGIGQATANGKDAGDFTVHAVFKNNPAGGSQYLLSGPIASTAGFYLATSGGDLYFGAFAIFALCPAPTANVWMDYIGIRKSGVMYCFRSTVAAPTVSAGTDATTLGTFNIYMGEESGSSIGQYFNGSIGTVLVWNRALCSTQVAGTCAAGQVDEVQREFSAAHKESPARGWSPL